MCSILSNYSLVGSHFGCNFLRDRQYTGYSIDYTAINANNSKIANINSIDWMNLVGIWNLWNLLKIMIMDGRRHFKMRGFSSIGYVPCTWANVKKHCVSISNSRHTISWYGKFFGDLYWRTFNVPELWKTPILKISHPVDSADFSFSAHLLPPFSID